MAPYRSATDLLTWHVECPVRGPFGPVVTTGAVRALDETSAIEAFVEQMTGEGFEVVGQARARRAT